MFGSSYMASPTWLYLPGAILVLKDRYVVSPSATMPPSRQSERPLRARTRSRGPSHGASLRGAHESGGPDRHLETAVHGPDLGAGTGSTGRTHPFRDDLTRPRLGFDEVEQAPGEPEQEFATRYSSVSPPLSRLVHRTFFPELATAPAGADDGQDCAWVDLSPARPRRHGTGRGRRPGRARG